MQVLFVIFIFNIIFFYYLDKISYYLDIYDYPDKKRKFHSRKAAVLGGLIIYLNYLLFLILIKIFSIKTKIIFFNDFKDFSTWILFPSLFFFIGLIDDKKNLKGITKFFLLIFLYAALVYIDDSLQIKHIKLNFTENIYNLSNFSFFFTVFCLVSFNNAFNMIDGINLQAGIYSISVLLVLYFFYSLSNDLIPLLFGCVFYIYANFKKNVFLGDGGVNILSFLLALLIIKNFNELNNIFSDEILVIMLMPGLEMIRVFVIRILKKKNPLEADRNHIHHLLLVKFKNKNINLVVSIFGAANFIFICAYFFYNKLLVLSLYLFFYFLTIHFLRRA